MFVFENRAKSSKLVRGDEEELEWFEAIYMQNDDEINNFLARFCLVSLGKGKTSAGLLVFQNGFFDHVHDRTAAFASDGFTLP